MDPTQVTIRAGQMVELRLLAHPENAECQKAHEIRDELRRKRDEDAPQVVFTMNSLGGGHSEVEHQERHRHGKNAIAQGRETFNALTGDFIVRELHGH